VTDLGAVADAPGLAVGAEEHLVDRVVQHEGAAVDGAQAREALGQPAQAVDRVDVRRLGVPDVSETSVHYPQGMVGHSTLTPFSHTDRQCCAPSRISWPQSHLWRKWT
jgi:hypothetical protein